VNSSSIPKHERMRKAEESPDIALPRFARNWTEYQFLIRPLNCRVYSPDSLGHIGSIWRVCEIFGKNRGPNPKCDAHK